MDADAKEEEDDDAGLEGDEVRACSTCSLKTCHRGTHLLTDEKDAIPCPFLLRPVSLTCLRAVARSFIHVRVWCVRLRRRRISRPPHPHRHQQHNRQRCEPHSANRCAHVLYSLALSFTHSLLSPIFFPHSTLPPLACHHTNTNHVSMKMYAPFFVCLFVLFLASWRCHFEESAWCGACLTSDGCSRTPSGGTER